MTAYKTTWKVIDENDKVLFEGLYSQAEQFVKENQLKNVRIEPFMEEAK